MRQVCLAGSRGTHTLSSLSLCAKYFVQLLKSVSEPRGAFESLHIWNCRYQTLEDLCSSLHTPAYCDYSWQLQVSVYWNKLLEKCSVACFLWITYGLVCAGIFTLSLGGSQIEKGKGTVFEMLILWSRAALSQRFFTWALYMFILDLEELMSHLLEWGGVLQKKLASPSCWNTLSKCCKSESASLPARSVIASVF